MTDGKKEYNYYQLNNRCHLFEILGQN
jgi:hypothetical protein